MYTLHLLKEKSYYGNEIIDEINYRLNNIWSPSPGMIYPLLRELESNGYIEGWWDQPEKRSIRRYRITESGNKHLERIKLKNKPSLENSLTIITKVLEDIYGINY